MQNSTSHPKMLELMKRDRKLQAIAGQRELTQAEKDEWEELVRQITALQEELQDQLQDAGES
ncbi:MAG: hypothetical protein H7222_08670 [Methylotenera sp.]|nr:hypothetical protein [Oligoflexia bacterium]